MILEGCTAGTVMEGAHEKSSRSGGMGKRHGDKEREKIQGLSRNVLIKEPQRGNKAK